LLLSQECQEFAGDVYRLQSEGAYVVDIAYLSKHTVNADAEPGYGSVAPDPHFWVSCPAFVDIVAPVRRRKVRSENPILLANDQIQIVADEGAMLDGCGKAGLCCQFTGTIAYHLPQGRVHQDKAGPEQVCDADGRFWAANL